MIYYHTQGGSFLVNVNPMRSLNMFKKKTLSGFAGLILIGALCVVSETPVFGHGYVGGLGSDLISRAAMKGNTNLGSAQYNAHGLEAPKGFPAAGPVDGKLASADEKYGGNLDAQSSTRWVKNDITTGMNTVVWKFTAPHRTSKWAYYITKNGWNQNAPLTRDVFETLTTIPHDGSEASNNPSHTINIPANKSGYHVIYAVWDIADTPNAFYNVIDVNIQGGVPDPDPDPDPDPEVPNKPDHIHSMGTTHNSVDLMWSMSIDNVGVTHYSIYRGGTTGILSLISTTADTRYKDTGLKDSTTYRYQIIAHYAVGNTASSNIFTVTTNASSGDYNIWDTRGTYTKGDRVTHNGFHYEAIQSYQGHGDPNWIKAPSLWKKI
jgi:chitin-binding protein